MSTESSAGWRMGGIGPGLPVILLLVFANFLRTDKTALRPPVQRGERPLALEVENLPTQLWRDPLGAVYAGLARASAEVGRESMLGVPKPCSLELVRASFPEAPANDAKDASTEPRPRVHVVAMLVPGGTRPEDIELRVRHRHALVAAFGAFDLNAQVTDRIGFVGVVPLPDWDETIALGPRPLPAPARGDAVGVSEAVAGGELVRVFDAAVEDAWCSEVDLEGTAGVVLPFEWYEPSAEGPPALVVWLDEDVLGRHPLLSAYYLLGQLLPEGSERAPWLHIVGPSNSGTLSRMLADDARLLRRPEPWGRVRIVSPRSTVDPETIYREAGLDPRARITFETADFERTIGTDAELARLLAKELIARLHWFRPVPPLGGIAHALRSFLQAVKFDPPRRRDPIRVALISESDTSYGRAWQRLLEDAVERLNQDRRAIQVRRWVLEMADVVEEHAREADDSRANHPSLLRGLVRSRLTKPDERQELVREVFGEPATVLDRLWSEVLDAHGSDLARVQLDPDRFDVEYARYLAGKLSRALHARFIQAIRSRRELGTSWVVSRIESGLLEGADGELVELLSAESLAPTAGAGQADRAELRELFENEVANLDEEDPEEERKATAALESLVSRHFARWFVGQRENAADLYADDDALLRRTYHETIVAKGGIRAEVRRAIEDAAAAFVRDVEVTLDAVAERELAAWWRDYPFEFVPAARYLRGIDGRVAGEDRAPVPPGQEPAIGEAQLDYVRRLERLFEGQRFHAVGILGNDVYDKLSLLAVLRPRFRSSLFFTTDLDARLLPSRANQATLNLLVASHYGLVLDPEHQEGHPPFRSGYQASVYLAAQRAATNIVPIGGRPDVLASSETEREVLTRRLEREREEGFAPHARLFETGRTWFHPLEELALEGVFDAKATDYVRSEGRSRGIDANQAIADAPQAWLFVEGHPAGVLAALLLALVCLLSSKWVQATFLDFVRDLGRWHTVFTVAIVIPAAVIGLVALFARMKADGRGLGEPFRITEGISVWPTIWIRVGVIGLCHFGWLVAIVSVERFKREARARWFGADLRDDPDVAQAWRSFERSTWAPRITLWALVATLVYYVGTSQVFRFLGGDMAPTRGEVGYIIERFVLFISIVWFVLLLAWIFRAMLLARTLIRRLGRIEPDRWPDGVLEELRTQRGLKREAAARALPTLVAESVGRHVNGLIWFPALAMFGMVVSRASLFDSWGWPPSLIFTLALSFLLTLLSGHHVRRAAIDEREDALQHLRRLRQRSSSDAQEGPRLAWLVEELGSLRTGAFAPIIAHPLLRAWLLPIAGLGTNSILGVLLPTVVGHTG